MISKDTVKRFCEMIESGKEYNIVLTQRRINHDANWLLMAYCDITTKAMAQASTSDNPLKFVILTTEDGKAHSESMREKLIQMLTYAQLADKVSIEVVTPKTAND